MRRSFLKTLTEIAAHDDRIVFLTGDLGFSVVEPFRDRFPMRFFNVGVAEQNMLGVATGLAEDGYLPFCFSIATFATLRPYEFIRNGASLHGLPVRIIGVGGGFEYGTAGPTHWALEDVGVMRLLPNMTVVVPADAPQASAALRATWDLDGPVYYRIGKDESRRVPGLDGRFELGRLVQLGEGRDVLFLASGAISSMVAEACDALRSHDVSSSLVVVSTLAPPPTDALLELFRTDVALVATVETHRREGGLGSVVAGAIADAGLSIRLLRFGIEEPQPHVSGSESYLLGRSGLTVDHLVEACRKAWPGDQ